MPSRAVFYSLLFLTISLQSFSQDTTEKLLAPSNWDKEKFNLPPEFASSLPFKGTENIRFSPDWAKKNTKGYWTYCFLWTIQGNPPFSKSDMENYLRSYYSGLVKANLIQSKIDTSYAIPVEVTLKKEKDGKDDLQVYEGKIKILDYMTQDPISLNLRAIIKNGKGHPRTIAFFEVSPQSYNQHVWDELNKIFKSAKDFESD